MQLREQALTKAREVMAAGATAVHGELETLRNLREELDALAGIA